MTNFYEEEVHSLVQLGNQMTGADFRIEIQDCPALSQLTVSCDPLLPGRHAVESVPGRGGIEVNMPGRQKTGGVFPITFTESINGDAFSEYIDWSQDSIDFNARKSVKIYSSDELNPTDGSILNITYLYCWPEANEAGFDYENKTSAAKFTCNIHFAHRKWTEV